jgi:uncharacterized protein
VIAPDVHAVDRETPAVADGSRLRSLPPAAVRVWQLSNAVGTAVAIAVVVAFFRSPLAPGSWRAWEPAVLSLLVAVALLEACVAIPLRHRYYRYAVLESSVVVVKGRLFHRQLVVPLRHVLHVDTRQGPLLRIWGLFEVRLGTIAEAHSFGPLPEAVAEACRRAVEAAGEAE